MTRLLKIILLLLLPTLSFASGLNNDKLYFKDRIIVAKGDKQFAPFEFINGHGEADGFSVELFRAMMKRLNIQYTLSLDDWGTVQEELKNKEIDLAIGMIYSRERAEKVKFGIPHSMISYNIICRKDNDFLSLDSLRGKEIIVQNKDRAHEHLLTSGLTDKIITVDNIYDGVKLLNSGQHDAVISFDISSFYFVRKGHFKNLIVHMTDIEPERYSIVVNTDNEELLYLLNAVLYQMKIEGEYDNIYYKWFGVYEKSKVNPIVWYILIMLGLILVICAVFIWLLRIKVNESTRHLKSKNKETLCLVDQLQAENQRRQIIEKHLIEAKEKAEESDRLKSAFLANISHEIRTPLNAIVGFSSILSQTDEQEDREKFYEIIEKNNDLLLQLINDVLDLSKIESGMMIMNYTTFDLGSLCNQIIVSIGSIMPHTEVKLIQKFDYAGPMYSDRARVTQVITNFMTNASKFTTQGSITLHTCLLEKATVEISVSDTGIGIEQDKQQAVFERFVKLSTFSQGTGLGLSICKNIVEKLGGEIGIKSTLGQGSTFWMRLPLGKTGI